MVPHLGGPGGAGPPLTQAEETLGRLPWGLEGGSAFLGCLGGLGGGGRYPPESSGVSGGRQPPRVLPGRSGGAVAPQNKAGGLGGGSLPGLHCSRPHLKYVRPIACAPFNESDDRSLLHPYTRIKINSHW